MPDDDTYRRLIALLDEAGAEYRLIDHPPEGATDVVSALRGHPPAQAAKCLVLIVNVDRRTTRYVGFADAATAERLARSAPGTVLSFSFDPDLDVIADLTFEGAAELYFNAARLDRSVAMRAADYLRIARPRMAAIAVRG